MNGLIKQLYAKFQQLFPESLDSMEMTNALRRLINDLDSRRQRRANKAWKAEGTKCVLDLIHAFPVRYLIATHDWLQENADKISFLPVDRIIQQSAKQIERISRMDSTPPVVAVFELPVYSLPVLDNDTLYLALDTVQDPGNLGTIIRTADWFGIRDILCSPETVDAFSPKVVMATMGALARVRVHYCDLIKMLEDSRNLNVYGTFLDGNDIYLSQLSTGGIVIMGNEGRGVSRPAADRCNCRLKIPSYPKEQPTSESLNVGSATAIVLSEFRRRQY